MGVSTANRSDFEKPGGRLPAPPPIDAAGCGGVYRASSEPPFEDSFLLELAESAPLRRLRDIGFLGAIEYAWHGAGSKPRRRRHTRYDHSVGVARLALLYAGIRELPRRETRVLAAAGLLHDVGHGPLSHSLEPIFKQRFGVSHHETGSDIVRGRSGGEIPRIMARYRIDPDEVQDTIEGRRPGARGFLFSGPINLDTIEGIVRCYRFFVPDAVAPSATQIVTRIAESDNPPTTTLDNFWKLKHEIYNDFLRHTYVIVYDVLAKSYMIENFSKFRPDDFQKDESWLRNKHKALFDMFKRAGEPREGSMFGLPAGILDRDIEMRCRSFFIESSIRLDGPADLPFRYRQSWAPYTVRPGTLLSNGRAHDGIGSAGA